VKEKSPQPDSLALALLATSGPGDVRVGPILAIPDILTELGVSPQRAFAQAGVDPGLFQNPENRIQIETLGRLLEMCVALTGCHHFGLLVGERFDLKRFGPLGYLLRNSATVGEAMRSLLLHLHLHDRGAAPVLLANDPGSVILGYSVYRHGTPATDQILDGAIAIAYRILTELCGANWKPLRVQFSHSRPASIAPYRRVFRSNVSFDADVSGLVFASSWLDKRIEGADATLHDLVATAILDAQANGSMGFADQVERILPQMLLSGMASAGAIARLFAIHERTLRRRLEAEGKNLQQLINHTRFELAKQLLQNTALSVSEIAVALRYDDANAFSRAFGKWAQVSPTQWRRQHGSSARQPVSDLAAKFDR
jgi:AraC-like DNA-binding protein